ncbi:MAG: serine/threonine-protein kinase [Gammaproteobacteria bacterium]
MLRNSARVSLPERHIRRSQTSANDQPLEPHRTMSLHSGQRFKSYVVENRIASGGMGEVWRAWDEVRGRHVAVKAINDDLFSDSDFTNRFLDEVQRHVRLSHPNIVPVLDVFYEGGQNCLVMELIDGVSLADILNGRSGRRLPVSEALPVLKDLLRALDYAHMHGVIHRDVKPSNILIDREGRSYLIDFGIALAVGEKRRTRTGQTIGTPHYMSPEQIVSPRDIDHRSDVYSVGCVFYEMLTGRPPFIADDFSDGATDFAVKKAHVGLRPLPPAERVASIPRYLNDLVLFALEKQPGDRVPGCREFLRLLGDSDIRSPTLRTRFRWDYCFGIVLAMLWLLFFGSLILKG